MRWPVQTRGPAWCWDTDLAWIKDVVEHWLGRYDWRRREAEINRRPQFRVLLGGKHVHFLLKKGSEPAPESWVRRIFARLEQLHYAPRGGHFPAVECGALFLENVRCFFRRYR